MKKQETTSEGFHRISKEFDYSEFDFVSFKIGAEWQQERMYSEEDIVLILSKFRDMKMIAFSEWLEQFKKYK